MSNSCSELPLVHENQEPKLLPIKEMYSIINSHKNIFGIDGYVPPKNHLYLVRASKFPLEKRKDTFTEVKKRAKDPEPGKYTESKEKHYRRYWEKPNGKFLNGSRKGEIDLMIKRSKSVPACNFYFKDLPKLDEPCREKQLGKFDKCEKMNFISTTIYRAQQSPDPGKYNLNHSLVEYKSPIPKMVKTQPKKPKDKDKLGPGVYHDGVEKALKKQEGNQSFIIPKSKTPNAVNLRAHLTRFIPPVGNYKDIDLAYTKNHIFKRDRTAVINPYKTKSLLDEVQKNASWVPGPGSYDIVPPISK
ncbi:unnamed protein product [Blepharisma stoltei]|uniref:Uncharacterized protein n=1 Tax=Blepharisma stoltei TaxID=1481888 RepID=A0AAU9JEU9_9CILI|nr:unnamed protein product [Blepharisma stoltei]